MLETSQESQVTESTESSGSVAESTSSEPTASSGAESTAQTTETHEPKVVKGPGSIREKAQKRLAELAAAQTGQKPAVTAPKEPKKAPAPDKKAAPTAPVAKEEPKTDPKQAKKPENQPKTPENQGQKAGAETPPAAFDFKFKVKKEEKEIPAWLHDAVKSPEQLAELKETFEKAHGLALSKEYNAQLMGQNQTMSQEIQTFKSNIQKMAKAYNSDDLDTVFAMMGVKEEKVLRHVWNKLNYNKLPPEQRQLIDEQRMVRQRADSAEDRASQLERSYQANLIQARQVQFEQTLTTPDVSSVAQAYDTQVGKPGAFRQLVIDHGELTYHRSGRKVDLTPDEAVKQVMAMIGGVKSPAQAPAAQPTQTAAPQSGGGTQAPPAPQAHKVPVIPNVGASPAVSPTQETKRFKSVADVKKYYNETYGRR